VARATICWVLLGVSFLFAGAFGSVQSAIAAGTEYVDCAASPVGADGSQAHPWTSLSDASAVPLTPGSRLLLKRGTLCTGTLEPGGSGSPAAVAVIAAYGSGQLPQIVGDGEDAVRLENTSYTVLEDLDVSNPGDNTSKRRGVHLLATGQTLTGLTVRGLQIHDVDGNLDSFFGGSGGIQVDANGPGVGRFDGLSIEFNTIERVSRSGILINSVSRGVRPLAGQPWPEASTNVRITGNRLAHLAGDGIVTSATDGALVDHNVVSDGNLAGRAPGSPGGEICNAGIWALHANRTTIEHNEVFAMNLNGCDGTGFDIDRHQDGTVVQYNYSHDNGGGFLLLCTEDETRSAQVRFNLSVDDRFMLHSVPCASSSGSYTGVGIYNNTIVAPDPGFAELGTPSTQLYGPASLTFFNNIVAATGAASGFECAPACNHNLFWHVPPVGTHNVTGDPRFLDPSRRGTPDTPQGFQLLAGSPAIGTGAAIPAGVAADYFGKTIARSLAANIGFDQAKPSVAGPAPAPAPGRVPLLSSLRLQPRHFEAAQGRGPTIAKHGVTGLDFRLDAVATVDFHVIRVRRSSARGKRKVGGFELGGSPGENSGRFTGRIHRRPLQPGRYQLRAVATNDQGSSRELTVGFRVLESG
jgi:hypothetical protein